MCVLIYVQLLVSHALWSPLPMDVPGKRTETGCLLHFQGIFLTQGSNFQVEIPLNFSRFVDKSFSPF